MDTHRMWDDTALIVTTDHGFLLGEHDWWAKLVMPCYNEVAHIPLFVHHPDFASQAGTRRKSLTQTTDIAATILDVFGAPVPSENRGHSLLGLLQSDDPVRESAIYGVFGSAVNITDGRYTYFRYPENLLADDLFQYTLMPTHMKEFFSIGELSEASLVNPMPFSKGVPLLKVPSSPKSPVYFGHGPGGQQDTCTVLFDLLRDPRQLQPLEDPLVEERLIADMVALMSATDAPAESYRRLGLQDFVDARAQPRNP
jgi:hypothetical protein